MNNSENFQIEGKWINKQNGHTIIVSNYVSDGDTAIVMTSEGPVDMNFFMNNFVQMDGDDDIIEQHENINTRVKASDTIFNQEYTFDDDVQINPQTIETNNTTSSKQKVKINNADIIKKLFDKIETIPQIQTTILWDNFPKNEISTLINFLDVNIEDISTYIYHNIFNDKNIIDSITNILKEKLNNDSE